MSKSTKQKLNTKSSTEAEVVGASDYLPSTIWAMKFMEHQGHPITTSYYEQDNQSAMKLEKNGRASVQQKLHHIDIHYFWITDCIKKEGITIRYCPTEQMLSDFLTKPLQGSLFRKFRDVLLGHIHISQLRLAGPNEPEERVGDQDTPVPDQDKQTENETAGPNRMWADVVKCQKKIFLKREN